MIGSQQTQQPIASFAFVANSTCFRRNHSGISASPSNALIWLAKFRLSTCSLWFFSRSS